MVLHGLNDYKNLDLNYTKTLLTFMEIPIPFRQGLGKVHGGG